MTRNSIFMAISTLLLSYVAFSQEPIKDSIQFRYIRYTQNPLSIPQGNSTLLSDANAMGINTSSYAYQRMLAEIAPILDPKTLTVPVQAMYQAQEEYRNKLKNSPVSLVAGWNWYERGPNNIGGRTRALMFDPNDAANSYKKVWAGSVAGGLWTNTDITNAATSWTKVNDFWENLAVTCLAYDPSNTQRFYAGTGEGFGNIDYVQGAGIFYSADGGTTWTRLASTIPTGTAITDAFKFVQKIVINSAGEVFAATQSGILKSTNQGGAWAFVMQPSSNTGINALGGTNFVSDLEIGTDGVLYAATSSGRVVKSTDAGVTWTNITPASVLATSRTELALAASTSGVAQTLYVLSYSSTAANVWFKKSVDAGVNWTNVTQPSIGITSQGWYDLILQVHPTTPDAVYAAAVTDVRSINGGATWGAALSIHTDQHNIIFRPESNDMIIGEDGGVYYSSTWGDVANAAPTATARNTGYNVTQLYSVSLKNVTGDGYAIAGSQDNGTHNITTAYNTIGASGYVYHSDGMLSFIDQDNPNIQIATTQNLTYVLANASGLVTQTLLSFPGGDFINPSDYDDAANILYAKYTSLGLSKILKCNNVGTTNTIDSTTITGLTGGISFIKVGKTANTIFLGTSSGRVYKVSGMNVSSVAATLIGTLSYYVTSIDIGATDNEVLVTMSNSGVSSVRYTSDGGTTWADKDQLAYGLPANIPVRFGLFFPFDRKKVVVATDLGVFYCPDITLATPAWTDARVAASGGNLGNVRCDWMKLRTSDGMLAVGTHGRGIYFSDYFKAQVPLALNFTSGTLSNSCPSSSIIVKFETQGDFGVQTFTAQLSDATGSFASPTSLGAVTPYISNATMLPASTGAGFKIRVVASGGIISTLSNAFAIQSIAFNNSTPALVTAHSTGGIIKLSTTDITTAYWVAVPSAATAPSVAQIVQGQNAAGIATYAGSFAIDAVSTNRYLDITTLPAGTTFDVYLISQNCSSTTPIKITITTTGAITAYCTPTYSSGCAALAVIISRAKLSKSGVTLFDNGALTCSAGNYGSFLYPYAQVQPSDALTFNTEHFLNSGGSYYPQNLSVWVDYNRDGVFGNSVADPTGTEQVYISNLASAGYAHSGNFTIPAGTLPGFLRIRFRTQYRTHGTAASPCANYTYGETEDYIIWVNPIITTNALAFATAVAGSNVQVPFSNTGTFNGGNLFTVQVAPVTTGVFVAQTTTGSASPLTATLSMGLAGGEYITRAVSSNPAVLGVTSPTSFVISACPTSYNLTGSTANGTIKYESAGFIDSIQLLSGSAQIKYDGTSYIFMKPGFDARPATGFFTAYIDGCGGALRLGAPEPTAPTESQPSPTTKLIKPVMEEIIKK